MVEHADVAAPSAAELQPAERETAGAAGDTPVPDSDSPPSEGEEDEAAPAVSALLAGSAGARLLGVLTSISSHLGASSRFAAAASVLQRDVR